MMNWLNDNRTKLDHQFIGTEKRKLISPAYYSQYQVTLALVKQYARGKFIDLGCGDIPYRSDIENQVEAYDTLDFRPRLENVTYIGSVQDMHMIASDTYDSAICLEVLEHVPNPFQAVHEIWRILKKDGILVLSVPHLSRLHEIPYDYYRYTRYGLQHMLEDSGFTVMVIREKGGLLSFLGHQFSLAFLSAVWGIPLVREAGFALNALFVTRLLYWLDGRLKLAKLFPLGYAVVAKK